MPIFEDENTPREKLYELRKRNKCQVCGGSLNVFLDRDSGKAFLACWDYPRTHHEGIVREASQYEQKGLEALNISTRRKIMDRQFGDKGVALERYQGVLALKKAEALEILQTVFPDAPEQQMTRAVLLCTSYHLNPLMGHVFLIPFNKGKPNESWATVIGIKAKRLVASRRRPYMYLDDTPRLMNEAEQIKVFGKVDKEHIVAITILEDPQTGAQGRGYGKWEADKEPYGGSGSIGGDKGNTKENMAFIRSESQALDRLAPGEMPVGFEVVDEQFLAEGDTGGEGVKDVVEGEFKDIGEESKASTKEKKPTPALVAKSIKEEPQPNTVEELKELMAQCNWSATDAGAYFNKEKGWNIKDYKDLAPEQIKEAIQFIKENPK